MKSLLLALAALPTAQAWGAAGHSVVANLAERHLSPAAAALAAADLAAFAALCA